MKIIMKHLVVGLTLATVSLLSFSAMAEEPAAAVAKKNVHTTGEVRIVGNPQRPTAAIEVSKVRMKLGATTPTLTAIGQIHDAAKKDPF
jgi:hypothetical protein